MQKLNVMDVEINGNLLTIILLYSLPSSFENIRCAIETRDQFSDAESLKIKIIEEYESRKQKAKENDTNAMFLKQNNRKFINTSNKTNIKSQSGSSGSNIKYRCRKCNKIGHKAVDCYSKKRMTSNSEAGFTNQSLISEGRKQESALRANHHDKP